MKDFTNVIISLKQPWFSKYVTFCLWVFLDGEKLSIRWFYIFYYFEGRKHRSPQFMKARTMNRLKEAEGPGGGGYWVFEGYSLPWNVSYILKNKFGTILEIFAFFTNLMKNLAKIFVFSPHHNFYYPLISR